MNGYPSSHLRFAGMLLLVTLTGACNLHAELDSVDSSLRPADDMTVLSDSGQPGDTRVAQDAGPADDGPPPASDMTQPPEDSGDPVDQGTPDPEDMTDPIETCTQPTILFEDDFEQDQPGWYKYTDGRDWFTVDAFATDEAFSGMHSGTASSNCHGVCGVGGIARDFSLRAETLEVTVKARTSNWGRYNLMIKDANGVHMLLEKKGGGDAIRDDWSKLTFDISGYESDFTFIAGNADTSSNCDTFCDHAWTVWIDDYRLIGCP